MRMGTIGRYTASISDDIIKQAAERVSRELEEGIDASAWLGGVMADVAAITPEQMIELMPRKQKGGFMSNRKPVIKEYEETLEDPGYHEHVRLCYVLRCVPVNANSVILSFDKISVHR